MSVLGKLLSKGMQRQAARAEALRRAGIEPIVPDHLRGEDLVGRGVEDQITGGVRPLQEAAERYMRDAGIDYRPQRQFVEVDPEFATRVAKAYEEMKHNPNDPMVRAAYQKMIEETVAQYEALRRAGYKFDFMPEGRDPYGNPRNAIKDLVQNKRMLVFPTEAGFGGPASKHIDVSDNPLLMKVGEKWSGKDVTANDLFRAVHDAFGHAKEGVGFRARGEENAFQQHMTMYSPLAARAMATETRGQNSWVNFGPYAAKNRRASPADTEYAPQKVGLLPDELVFGRTVRADLLRRARELERSMGY
ncbi:MAG: hypothetical protein RMK97_02005 [Sutterellaceae bacterium]|nr:hypothetical protein [Burkholderiaceae bacterium]MDW8429268.1 hypothetical protein [Sutterellaceae bacterium]